MKRADQIKEMVRQKYSEMAMQDLITNQTS